MRQELTDITAAISTNQLPLTFTQFAEKIWDASAQRFHLQETYVLDFKDRPPASFNDSFGSSIVRLALAFFNSFGGVIVFGVRDRTLDMIGVTDPFDIESFNRVLSDLTGLSIECQTKNYVVPEVEGRSISVVLVPKRGAEKPARLNKDFGKYLEGTVWVRERHEVLIATSRHYATLYSTRDRIPSHTPEELSVPVHRSFPPSPSTMKQFVGRNTLMENLWDWFLFGDQPRLYLHGPGGSGKSTLAFEFARLLVNAEQRITLPNGEILDYAIFLSAKETELNPHTRRQQSFKMRQFSSSEEQFNQVLYHSGMISEEDINALDGSNQKKLLEELFSNFNGLIVIDDIDALSRQKKDTGEETLFLRSVMGSKRTRILYTLRFPPVHAMNSAMTIPGLAADTEFYTFVEACTEQFGVPRPQAEFYPLIQEATSALPLLIETLIGIRKFSSNYREAVADFKDKGGDEARRYLYQREYDGLDNAGKSRYVLAGLLLLEKPCAFSTLSRLLNFSHEQVRDALNECGGIFITTAEGEESGETLYQLTPPCIPFLNGISTGLHFYAMLKRTVEHYKTQGQHATPHEAAILVTLERLVRQKRYNDILAIEKALPRDDAALVNPKIQSLFGQAYATRGPQFKETARQSFRAAEAVGVRDIYMMRSWYHLEFSSGYGIPEAVRLCRLMIADEEIATRYRSEFLSKLANCHFTEGNSFYYTDREKALDSFKTSVFSYIEAVRIGSKTPEISLEETIAWLEKPLYRYLFLAKPDADLCFKLFEDVAELKHEMHAGIIDVLQEAILTIPAPTTKEKRIRYKNACTRIIGKINKNAKPPTSFPNTMAFSDFVDKLRSEIENLEIADAPKAKSAKK